MCSIVLSVAAGFVFYMVSLLGFVRVPSPGAKWGIMIGALVPAAALLCGALALARFRGWKRHAGIVLLSASGVTGSVALTVVCLLATEEFRTMMPPDTMASFGDYRTGGLVVGGLAGLGWILIRARSGSSRARWRPRSPST